MQRWRHIFLVFLMAGVFPLPAAAVDATAPGAALNTIRNIDEFYQRQQQLEKLKERQRESGELVDTGPEDQQPAAGNGAEIQVNRIVVDPSRILTEAEISLITEKYQGRRLSVSQLFQMLEELNALYRDRNFITARAVLPKQKVVDGVIHIRLVEATLDRLVVENNQSTRESFITSRMDLASGELADINRLERELIRFNQRNDVSLRATLKPGSEPGTTRYHIAVREPKHLEGWLFADNAGRETIGRNRVGAGFVNSSLTGYRDRLSLGATHAEGTDSGYISYSIPVNRFGTRLTAGYDYSEIAIISGGLAAFNIEGQSSIASLGLTHPLYFTGGFALHGVAGFEAKDSETDFDNVDSFSSTQRVFDLGLDMQDIDAGRIWYIQPRLNSGVDSFGGDERYTYFYGEAAALFGITDSQELLLRMQIQFSDMNDLPSSEEFQLGGTASVRGYEEGRFIGDEGYLTSFEYRFGGRSMAAPGLPDATVRPLVFLDHGAVGSAGTEYLKQYLTSAGVGVTARYSDRLTLSAQLGIPLDPPPEITDDYRFHLQLKYSPL